MADIIQMGNISVCRKPSILFNDGEHFPIEISFSREITDADLATIAMFARILDEMKKETTP